MDIENTIQTLHEMVMLKRSPRINRQERQALHDIISEVRRLQKTVEGRDKLIADLDEDIKSLRG